MMRYWLALATAGATASLALGSFLDREFGPLDYQEHGNLQLVQQLDDYEDGFVKIPSKDYVDDLSPAYGPLYSGVVTFAHLPQVDCIGFTGEREQFDIAIIGAPFDTGVSYRPGARFGPGGIREGSRRLGPGSYQAYRPDFDDLGGAKIVECGDVPMTPFDNRIALDQLYRGHRAILGHRTSKAAAAALRAQAAPVPRILTLGGDHTVTFSALRAASERHGPVAVIHFDSHIDTWEPIALGGNISSYQSLNHGTFLHYAHEKGYILNDTNIHVGMRAPLIRKGKDIQHDKDCGFDTILARDVDKYGIQKVIDQIRARVGNNKVYITVDIDVLDPAYAPGTGTVEPGGFTTRELLTILDGLEGLDVIGADVVEVSPPYDTNGQLTVTNAAEVSRSLIDLMLLGPA